ncbi:MAG TPA: metal ABC transporter permease [Acidimicrobiales bacterium]|jgi:zinc/manganese transport system permease protein|nr:metal ABC transporter permease [Acidimicrobiales bacterium]
MFSPLMQNTWTAATIVAVVAGAVGFFVVARGLAFAAHALPNGAFAGAAGATLVGASPLLGLGLFSVGGALSIGALGRRARHDVATALTIVAMLGLGSLFLTLRPVYAPAVSALLFGQLFGVSNGALIASWALGAVCLVALGTLYRPLLFSSLAPDVGAARGIRPQLLDAAFLILIALVTTTAVPIVGALLVFSLLIAPAAAARRLVDRPGPALAWGVVLALLLVWVAVAVSYETNLPPGFLVGGGGAVMYALAGLHYRHLP